MGVVFTEGFATPVPKLPQKFSLLGGLVSEHIQGSLEVLSACSLRAEPRGFAYRTRPLPPRTGSGILLSLPVSAETDGDSNSGTRDSRSLWCHQSPP